jgi:hypothetical protein
VVGRGPDRDGRAVRGLTAFRAEAEAVRAGPASELLDDVFAGP